MSPGLSFSCTVPGLRVCLPGFIPNVVSLHAAGQVATSSPQHGHGREGTSLHLSALESPHWPCLAHMLIPDLIQRPAAWHGTLQSPQTQSSCVHDLWLGQGWTMWPATSPEQLGVEERVFLREGMLAGEARTPTLDPTLRVKPWHLAGGPGPPG